MNSMIFCLLFIFTGINKILTYFICKSNSQIGKNTAVQAQFFVTLLMYKNIYIEKYQSLSAQKAKQTAVKLPVLPKRSQFSKKKSIFDICICVSYLIRPRIASKIALTIACASKEAPAKPRIFSIISKIVANMCDVLPSPLIRQLFVPYN